MDNLVVGLLIISGLLSLLAGGLLKALLKVVSQLAEVNKQLLIVVAGKDQKPEALRALVASNKPPQKKIKGIADGKKEDKSKNTNHTVEVGVG